MSAAPIRLSVLDQSPVIYGHSARDAIAATVDLAQLTDALGYTRYWCAEHHGLRGVSNPAPEVMIARVASATKHLRVGSGGVMLPYYSPFKLAEQFRLLEALFPNRIDLGVESSACYHWLQDSPKGKKKRYPNRVFKNWCANAARFNKYKKPSERAGDLDGDKARDQWEQDKRAHE